MYQSSIRLLCVALTLATFMFSCQPDNVKPTDQAQNGTPSLSADESNPHPLNSPACSGTATIRLATANGDFNVDYCGPITCPPGMPEWGFVDVLNTEDEVLMNVTMAIGWFIDKSKSKIGFASDFSLDVTGLPVQNTDWRSDDIDPVVNRWQLAYDITGLPSPCFDMSMKFTVVKLNFFSGVDAASETELWAYNENWNSTDPNARTTASPFLTSWCPALCLPDPADCTRDYKTYSQCQYGTCGADGPAATYRDANFASAFPGGITIGCATGHHATFTNAAAVQSFLPTQGGQLLSSTTVDPTGRVANNSNFNFCADWNANNACATIDFDTDGVKELANGNPLAAGMFVTNQYADDIGLTISGESNNNNRSGDVIIFDSSNPTGGDWDLGTPNAAYGGPGQGSGGTSAAGKNDVAEGNIIILAENVNDNNSDGLVDNPDDDASGGVITFDFASPTTIQAVTLVDLDDNANNVIKLYFADNRAPLVVSVPQIGNNSKKIVMTKEADNTDADGVVKIEVSFSGSGGIAGLCYCLENPYSGNACVNNAGQGIRSTLAGRTLTATLNVGFDAADEDFGAANFPLGYMEVRNGVFAGKTVNEVIALANEFLGGCSSTYTKQDFNGALNKINKSFLNGERQNNYLVCPSI